MAIEKENAPTPGQEADERGSRHGQDLPGAAQGDRQKFKDMINAGQDKKPIAPKAYPGAEAPKDYGVIKDDSGSVAFNETTVAAADGHSNSQGKPGENDRAFSNPWGNQQANRSATLMGGDPESGHTRTGEGPVWVPMDEKPGSDKSQIRPTALGQKPGMVPDGSSKLGPHSSPADLTRRVEVDDET